MPGTGATLQQFNTSCGTLGTMTLPAREPEQDLRPPSVQSEAGTHHTGQTPATNEIREQPSLPDHAQ